ncbi:hypothetical protein D3C84_964220 [compost metagenome]
MALAVADLHLLRVCHAGRLAQPRLWQLPEQRSLAQVLARLLAGQQQATGQCLGQRLGQVPGQALAGGVAGQQPITGGPQGLIGALGAQPLQVNMQGSAHLQAQLDQRAAFEGQAQPAVALLGTEIAPAWR